MEIIAGERSGSGAGSSTSGIVNCDEHDAAGDVGGTI